MKTYLSKSSNSVKIITGGSILCVMTLIFSLIFFSHQAGLLSGTIIAVITLVIIAYFYAVSLKAIRIENNNIILQKPFNNVQILISDVLKVEKLGFSNLSMTYGSQGFFGYVGSTMDGSLSMVKDRNQMIRIVTKNQSYILSSESPDELIKDINSAKKTK